jgi:hypothetical protein
MEEIRPSLSASFDMLSKMFRKENPEGKGDPEGRDTGGKQAEDTSLQRVQVEEANTEASEDLPIDESDKTHRIREENTTSESATQKLDAPKKDVGKTWPRNTPQRVEGRQEKARNPYARTYRQRPVRNRHTRDALGYPCPDINIHCAYTLVDLDGEDKPLKWRAAIRGPDKEKWEKANIEEWERLLGTSKTLKFIHHDEKPGDRLASYYNPQVKKKIDPTEGERFRVRGTYGGDKTDWDGPRSALTASMTTVKLNLNATISEGANWMTADIVDYYLGTPLLKK